MIRPQHTVGLCRSCGILETHEECTVIEGNLFCSDCVARGHTRMMIAQTHAKFPYRATRVQMQSLIALVKCGGVLKEARVMAGLSNGAYTSSLGQIAHAFQVPIYEAADRPGKPVAISKEAHWLAGRFGEAVAAGADEWVLE